MTPEEMKKNREKLKLSQEDLADEFDRSRRYIQYQEGSSAPIDRMLRYAMIGLMKCRRKKVEEAPESSGQGANGALTGRGESNPA